MVYADGSKDLYPAGVNGGRAFLESMTYNSAGGLTHSFYNRARHFAYVKKGEILAVASSAQGIGDGTIWIISPSGMRYSSGNGSVGRIEGAGNMNNRQAELAGPRVGYNPFEIPIDEEGIWMVEFTTPDSTRNNNSIPNIFANDNWEQRADQNIIAAWDVSVRSAGDAEWLAGRVYVNVLNLHMNGGNMANSNRAFFGVNYVLTKDGYYYKVDGNGSIGLKFTYFVNNSGVLNANSTPTYKSSTRGYNARMHDPNSSDIGNEFVTHKIFFTIPNEDLPKVGYSRLGNTWLLNEIQIAKVTNVRIGSSEGTLKHINTKGSVISFETNYAGRYKLTVKSKSTAVDFAPFEIIVQAKVGTNEFVWKGVDGNNNLVPVGNYDIQVSIASVEGEVHFPYFDTEINPNGLRLERYDRVNAIYAPAILYWDDSDIPRGGIPAEHSNPIVNLNGIPSNINGHRWGTYSVTTGAPANNNLFTGSNSFGNNMAMDTWSYAVQVEEYTEKNIIVEVADLEVVSVVADKDTIELNEFVNYKIVVRNNGPSDVTNGKFEYSLPVGFIIDDLKLQMSDCANIGTNVISNNKMEVSLNIKNGCEVEFLLKTHANNLPNITYGLVLSEAGIVRSKGITDPDATWNDIAALEPKSAKEECSPQGCNNIKSNREVFLLEPFNERGQIAVMKTAKHIDQNKSGFQEEGETIEYIFTVKNIGQVNVRDLIILDTLLSKDTIYINDIVLFSNQQYQITLPYTITAEDVQRGIVRNQAQIIGKNPRNFDVKDISGTAFTNNDITTIDIDKRPLFQLKKAVVNKGTGEDGQFTLGDEIKYRFDVKHEGIIGLSEIKLTDTLLFSLEKRFLSDQLSNQTLSFKFSYTITKADIQKGVVENSAIVEGVDAKYGNLLRDTSGNTYADDDKTITVLAKPPVAHVDSIVMYQSQIVNLKILDNDRKGSSKWDRGKIEIIDAPTMGRLDVDGLNVVFSQYNNFESGDDFFTYRIHDNSRLISDITRVSLTILKTMPIAKDDYYVQYYNSGIKVLPTKNDYVEYTDLDVESISVVKYPLSGTLVYIGNGEFTYTSHKTFSGIDEFTYRIMDKNGNWSELATVKIEVSGILIPNVITPNGDGLNDTFEIIGIYQFESIELQVFDRFKNLMYQNSNYKNNWEVNSSVRDGTYFYLLKMNKKGEKPILKKGSILITREMLN